MMKMIRAARILPPKSMQAFNALAMKSLTISLVIVVENIIPKK
jgi:hypothetical protein